MIDYEQYYQQGGTYVIPVEIFNDLLGELEELHKRIEKAIEYIKKYQQIYDIDGSIEKQIDEFNILASPKMLLEILKDSDYH